MQIHPVNVLLEFENRLDVLLLIYFSNPSAVGIYLTGVSFCPARFYVSNSITSIYSQLTLDRKLLKTHLTLQSKHAEICICYPLYRKYSQPFGYIFDNQVHYQARFADSFSNCCDANAGRRL